MAELKIYDIEDDWTRKECRKSAMHLYLHSPENVWLYNTVKNHIELADKEYKKG